MVTHSKLTNTEETFSNAPLNDNKRILCYGDSNTWGYMPGSGQRYPSHIRWPGVVSSLLGQGYTIIENGLNGRTTTFDDYYVKYLNGKEGLGYAIASQKPLDLVIISLGTNDLRFTDAFGSSKGLEALVCMLREANHSFHASECPIFTEDPKILVVSPIHLSLDSSFQNTLSIQYEQSFKFAEYYENIARKYNTHYLDASMVATPCTEDGIHMSVQSHALLGQAIYEKILKIFHPSNSPQ